MYKNTSLFVYKLRVYFPYQNLAKIENLLTCQVEKNIPAVFKHVMKKTKMSSSKLNVTFLL